MSEDAKRSRQSLETIIDGLYRNHLRNKAWIAALHEAIVTLQAEREGMPRDKVKSRLKERQRLAFQRFLEQIEKKDPGLAALLDDRDISEVE
jgi:hypothetical protein